jgi:hypothetical protein
MDVDTTTTPAQVTATTEPADLLRRPAPVLRFRRTGGGWRTGVR